MTTKDITYKAIMNIRCSAKDYPELRRDTGIAEILGVTKSTLSRIATGVNNPSTEIFRKIMKLHLKVAGGKRTFELIINWLNK